MVLKATKTGRTHTLSLSRVAKDALRLQRTLQARERLANGHYYRNIDDAIFTDELGSRVTPMAATCAFDRIARRLFPIHGRSSFIRTALAPGEFADDSCAAAGGNASILFRSAKHHGSATGPAARQRC